MLAQMRIVPYTSTFVIKRTRLGEFKEDERYLEQTWIHLEAWSQTLLSETCAIELFVLPLSFWRGLLHSIILGLADQYKQGSENSSEEWLTETGYLSTIWRTEDQKGTEICHMTEGLGLFHVILKYMDEISMDLQEGRFTYTQGITFHWYKCQENGMDYLKPQDGMEVTM